MKVPCTFKLFLLHEAPSDRIYAFGLEMRSEARRGSKEAPTHISQTTLYEGLKMIKAGILWPPQSTMR